MVSNSILNCQQKYSKLLGVKSKTTPLACIIHEKTEKKPNSQYNNTMSLLE